MFNIHGWKLAATAAFSVALANSKVRDNKKESSADEFLIHSFKREEKCWRCQASIDLSFHGSSEREWNIITKMTNVYCYSGIIGFILFPSCFIDKLSVVFFLRNENV